MPAGEKPGWKHQRWSCPKCGFTALNQWQKMNHIRRHHTGEAIPRANAAIVVKPSEALPASQREWECPVCRKAQPHLSIWQRTLAIREHLRTEHPDEDADQVRKRARRRDVFVQAHARGRRKGIEDRVRQHIDDEHDVVMWDRCDGKSEDETRGWRPVMACRKCVRVLGPIRRQVKGEVQWWVYSGKCDEAEAREEKERLLGGQGPSAEKVVVHHPEAAPKQSGKGHGRHDHQVEARWTATGRYSAEVTSNVLRKSYVQVAKPHGASVAAKVEGQGHTFVMIGKADRQAKLYSWQPCRWCLRSREAVKSKPARCDNKWPTATENNRGSWARTKWRRVKAQGLGRAAHDNCAARCRNREVTNQGAARRRR